MSSYVYLNLRLVRLSWSSVNPGAGGQKGQGGQEGLCMDRIVTGPRGPEPDLHTGSKMSPRTGLGSDGLVEMLSCSSLSPQAIRC